MKFNKSVEVDNDKKKYVCFWLPNPPCFWGPKIPTINFFSSPEPHLVLFSRSTGPISTNLGTKHPLVKGIQVCSKEGPSLSPRVDN